MLGGPCRYLEHLHTTVEKVSSATLQEVFGLKMMFFKVPNSQNILMKMFEIVMFQPKTSCKVTLETF